ncbi:AfsA-related hotdog domain-containing protein [Streptomyces sp. NPDC004658]|uniref:AfsA-related hotdog domain-containing protein n=1 Tax=Streptomyces sp. NPDC004658 TaxID=3154672 RepID=UPI0033BF1A02
MWSYTCVIGAQLPLSHPYFPDQDTPTARYDAQLLTECCRQAGTYVAHTQWPPPLPRSVRSATRCARSGAPTPPTGDPPRAGTAGAPGPRGTARPPARRDPPAAITAGGSSRVRPGACQALRPRRRGPPRRPAPVSPAPRDPGPTRRCRPRT